MKCLSLWNPWATLMVTGKKRVETRSWPIKHRGPMLIQAAKKWNYSLQNVCLEPFIREALSGFGVPPKPHNWTLEEREREKAGWGMGFGVIIGRVDVIECYPTSRVSCVNDESSPVPMTMAGDKMCVGETERAFGDYSSGRFAFLCENPVQFKKPVPCIGRQGLWNVPDTELPKEYRK